MELDGIDEAARDEFAWVLGTGVDEDADAQDFSGEGSEEVGVGGAEKALRFWPEVDA